MGFSQSRDNQALSHASSTLLDPDPPAAAATTTPLASSSLPWASSDSTHSALSPAAIFNVEGLVAVITGGGTGIGLMMGRALENNGATVYIIGRRRQVLEAAAAEHSKFGRIHPLEGDITDRDSLLSLVEKVKAQHGFIDLLVNNAGIARNLYPHPLPSPNDPASRSHDQHPPSPPASPGPTPQAPSIKAFQNTLWETGSPQDFADVFATNVTAPYYTTIAFLDLLHQGNIRRQRLSTTAGAAFGFPYQTSQVLTVSSSGSFRIDAKVLSPSYTLSKIAATHLGKLLANLLGPWGIRSNVLAPGVWPTGKPSASSSRRIIWYSDEVS
ncbi:short chain dehydrogenase/reductase family protein [Coprinopsis cinerea okayama7|uniref:Short chain dehydrogenase/reductase family protein n=1 Tax=Coprinopsis cinerea (strain Okayama-7 / 130 / ATCC MYA-4618 / FGSC 9003) TaxID=240176 RepID=A8NSQ1_COPC7|nr:short chain dehydrogenase/reductase family protein [Coprinopsis cinerea okayama7\|eukprot:XP_001836064.2 short chain dehydrogenase/reductase family protein [Coprinopsis cinerea okayama7\